MSNPQALDATYGTIGKPFFGEYQPEGQKEIISFVAFTLTGLSGSKTTRCVAFGEERVAKMKSIKQGARIWVAGRYDRAMFQPVEGEGTPLRVFHIKELPRRP